MTRDRGWIVAVALMVALGVSGTVLAEKHAGVAKSPQQKDSTGKDKQKEPSAIVWLVASADTNTMTVTSTTRRKPRR